jgi:hypothetical protein
VTVAVQPASVQPAFLSWAAAGFGAELVRLNTIEAAHDESPGKKPIDPAWQTMPVTPALVERWARTPANVGLRTRLFPVADIDVDDGPIAEAIEAVILGRLGVTAKRTRNNSARRALLFRLEGEPFKKVALRFKLPSGVFAKVEVLADGQQLAVAGMHVSGVPLEWPAGQPESAHLATMSRDRRDEVLTLLRARLRALGCVFEERNGTAQRAPLRAYRSSWEVDAEIADESLSRLDPDMSYEEWVAVGMALHAKDTESGGRAFDLWDSWSSKGDKYPGRDVLEKKWRSFKAGGIHFGSLIVKAGVSVRRHTSVSRLPEPPPRDEPPEPIPPPEYVDDEDGPATNGDALGLAPRPCDVSRLRERHALRFVSLADLPERQGWGEFLDKLTGGGLAPGSIVGLGAAGTGAGKTAFLMQLLDGLALRSSFACENPEATVPLTPVIILSEMAPEDLEARTLGRLLEVPGQVFLAGASAKRWHKWAWVDAQYESAERLMQPSGLYSRIAEWQRIARPQLFGPALVQSVEAYVDGWLASIREKHPGREVVPIVAVDPINRFLPLDGRSEVETLGELASDLDRLGDRRRWIILVTADTNKTAARDPSAAGNGAAVFRGTMQLLHAFDLTLVLEPGDADPDGVRDYGVRLDKNRYGRSDVGLNFRWHTRTGLRFVPESEEEWKKRAGEKPRPDDSEHRAAVVLTIADLVSAGVRVTRRSMQARASDLGVTRDALYTLIDSAIVHGELTEERAGRGGGMVLVPTGKGLEDMTPSGHANCPAELSEETVRNAPGQFGTVAQFGLNGGNHSGTNCPGELSRDEGKTSTVSERQDQEFP